MRGIKTKDGLHESRELLPKFLNLSRSGVCKSMISLASLSDSEMASQETPMPAVNEVNSSPILYNTLKIEDLDSSDDEEPDLFSDDESDSEDEDDTTSEKGEEVDAVLEKPPETEEVTKEILGCIFTMEDGSQHTLKEVLSTAGSRAITAKGTFRGKPINILFDTGSDIVYVSSRIAPRSEWKKVHGLKVRGFNRGIVNCPAKADIA